MAGNLNRTFSPRCFRTKIARYWVCAVLVRSMNLSNLLNVCPNLRSQMTLQIGSWHTGFNLVRNLAHGLHVGPILLGIAKPAHITTNSVTARGLANLAALAVLDAQVAG